MTSETQPRRSLWGRRFACSLSRMRFLPLALLLSSLLLPLHAETGADAWLRYAPLEPVALAQARAATPATVVIFETGGLESTAQAELVRGVRGMLGRTLRQAASLPRENAIVLTTLDQLRRAAPQLHGNAPANPEGFAIQTVAEGPRHYSGGRFGVLSRRAVWNIRSVTRSRAGRTHRRLEPLRIALRAGPLDQ